MRILLSAGEPSGDRIGAEIARELLRLRPDAELRGAAGPRMREQGVRPLADAGRFAHSGWSSIAGRIPSLLAAVVAYRARIAAFSPHAVVAVDAPGLNGPVLRAWRALGERRTWIAPPQLWAWRDRRPAVLRDLRVHPLHAFELDAASRAGARATWLGYPGPRPIRRDGPRDAIALFPGSRPDWRRRHAPLFLEAARRAAPDLVPVFAHPEARPGDRELGIPRLLPGDALGRAAVALVLPGTATLDAALEEIPAVVAARPGRLDAWIAGRLLEPGWSALPNRILGREVYPERLGTGVSVDDLEAPLRAAVARGGVEPGLRGMRERLGPPDAVERRAAGILERAGFAA